MRLSGPEQQIIKDSISVFDKQAKVVLFGSRTKDTARGGDIDLLIISDNIKQQNLGEIRWLLWEKLGEQKIDLVLSATQLSDTFARIAFEQPGTLIDTVNRTERRGLIANVNVLRTMTDLRNEIAHDYIKSELVEAFENILHQTPQVIALARRIKDYAVCNVNMNDS